MMLLLATVAVPRSGQFPTPPDSWFTQVGLMLLLILAAIASIYVAGWFIKRASGVPTVKALKFRGEGRCEQCGYDLRATPSRCPECGHKVEQRQLPRRLIYRGYISTHTPQRGGD